MREVIVGDIHGCLEEFDELLRTVQYRPKTDRLVLLGDLIDRGPDSIGVVRRARELNAESVKGNHENKYEEYRIREQQRLQTGRPNNMQFGPRKRAVYDQLKEEDWAYFGRMPLWIDLGGGLTAVHAGFEPGLTMAAQRPNKVVRCVYVNDRGLTARQEREDFFKKPDGSRRWAETFDKFDVVYGHAVFSLSDAQVDAVKGRSIEDDTGMFFGCTAGATHYGIDTGCYAGGRLTALIRTEKGREIVQVQAKREYEPRKVATL